MILRQFRKILSHLRPPDSARAPASGRQGPWLARERDAALQELRLAIRMGFDDQAMHLATALGDRTAVDAECLNLLGVIHERRGEWKLARKLYGRSIRRDRKYAPARQNMKRMYELLVFGHSTQPIALGDERPKLGMLLLERAQQATIPAQVVALRS